MSTQLEIAEAEAMKLTPAQRLDLVERLAESVQPSAILHPAWNAEIKRRLADLDAGRVVAIPADQVFDEIQALLTDRKPA